jgi:hypothetical protein
MCGGPRLIIVVLAMIGTQYGALTDEYELASRTMSCAVFVPAILVRFLSWLVLSKEDVRMALHKKLVRHQRLWDHRGNAVHLVYEDHLPRENHPGVNQNSYLTLKLALYTLPHVSRERRVRQWTQRHAV